MADAFLNKVRNTKPISHWTPLAARLEAEGQWHELTSLIENVKRKDWQTLPPRWQAALSRASVFSGQTKLAKEIIMQWSGQSQKCMESKIVLLLTQSALERRQQQWTKARHLATEARQLAKEHFHVQLEMDALFAEAVSYAEEGRIFLAIDLFQSIRHEIRPFSQYRKDLAVLNEAWCLWDLGQHNLLRPLLPQVPKPYRTKIKVYLAILENKTAILEHWVNNGFDSVEIFPIDLEQILLVLTEWAVLQDFPVHSLQKTWLYKELLKQTQDIEVTSKKLELCLLLLQEKFPKRSPEVTSQTDSVTKIEMQFLWLLSLVKKNPRKARLYYKKKLMPLMQEHRLCTPLIPQWTELETPFSPWSHLVAKVFGFETTHIASARQSIAKTLRLQNEKLFLEGSSQFLNLNTSPIAEALLNHLHGRKGQRFQKAELHYNLNKTAYRSHLHDARLHKLLKRLATRIEHSLHVTPWNMPGDNTIVLCCHLEVVS